MKKIKVAQDGTGDFISIQEAVNSIPEGNQEWITIELAEGIYKEKLVIEKPWIRLIGSNAANTVITYDDGAYKTFETGMSYGTFNSYSVFIGVHDFYAENITIENSAGTGDVAGQAIALYVDADRVHLRNCRLLGYQDTLFTGPLPPTPMTPGSFRGPRENSPRINGRQYYENCYIEGDVDFIFGSATAVFYKCEIFSKDRGQAVNGYITAPSTPEGQAFGYLFEACRLTSNCKDETVYLGRPWRDYAHAAFVKCEMGSHIIREGWHDWGKTKAHTTARFEEYKNTGVGSSFLSREKWSQQLSEEKANHYIKENILAGNDGWNPVQS